MQLIRRFPLKMLTVSATLGMMALQKILIKLKSYSDKLELLRKSVNNTWKFSNFEDKEENIEKVQTDFCKRALNVSKYASNLAVQGELGKFPLCNTTKSLVIKYWLRLCNGTKNTILNQAYAENVDRNLEWYQGIQYLLCVNGFNNVWLNPLTVNGDNFHKYFRQRLNDQYVQNWNQKMTHSSRFSAMHMIQENYVMSKYVKTIRDPEVREIYTRLRIDLNYLASSRAQLKYYAGAEIKCPLCNTETESVCHFLFKCVNFKSIREDLLSRVILTDPSFKNFSEKKKLRYVLDLQCPEGNVDNCCRLVKHMYTQRETEHIRITSAV